MSQSDMQPMSGGEYNAIVYEAVKLHVRLTRHSHDRALCGRLVGLWPEVDGHHWNETPERRCVGCDCLGPRAVLKLL